GWAAGCCSADDPGGISAAEHRGQNLHTGIDSGDRVLERDLSIAVSGRGVELKSEDSSVDVPVQIRRRAWRDATEGLIDSVTGRLPPPLARNEESANTLDEALVHRIGGLKPFPPRILLRFGRRFSFAPSVL